MVASMDVHKLIFSMTVERSDRTFVSGRWVGGMVGDDAVEVMLRWCIVYDDGCMISFHCVTVVVSIVSIVSIVSACRVSCIVYESFRCSFCSSALFIS